MYYIIINPIAGRGRTLLHLPVLTNLFGKHGLEYEYHVTKSVMDGYETVKGIISDTGRGCSGIIGIGGDGTFQEIAAGMIDGAPRGEKVPVPLGIFPGGSGNDFIMTLEGGKANALNKYKRRIEEAAGMFVDIIVKRRTRTVDAITANGTAFLNIGNIGLDARIVKNAIELKKKHGGRAYLAAVYKSIARHKNIPLTIEVNGEKWEKSYTLVAICNGQYYGGGLRISPSAEIDDGKITLCLVEAMSRPKTMVLFPSLMVEKHTMLKPVKMIECESLKITLPPGPETLCLDGNLYPCEGQIEFKILPGVMDVFV